MQTLLDSLQYAFGKVGHITAFDYGNRPVAGEYSGTLPDADTIGIRSSGLREYDARSAFAHEFGHKLQHSTDAAHEFWESPKRLGFGSDPALVTKAFEADKKGLVPDTEADQNEAFAEMVMKSWFSQTGDDLPSPFVGYPRLAKFQTPKRRRFVDSLVAEALKKIPPSAKKVLELGFKPKK